MQKLTHVEVIEAKHGAVIFGLRDGQLLTIKQETPCFFFVTAPNGKEIKISKKTRLSCSWDKPSTSPVFNV